MEIPLQSPNVAKVYWQAHSIARPTKRTRRLPTKHPSALAAKMKKAAN
jgi:hypothetical protein